MYEQYQQWVLSFLLTIDIFSAYCKIVSHEFCHWSLTPNRTVLEHHMDILLSHSITMELGTWYMWKLDAEIDVGPKQSKQSPPKGHNIFTEIISIISFISLWKHKAFYNISEYSPILFIFSFIYEYILTFNISCHSKFYPGSKIESICLRHL